MPRIEWRLKVFVFMGAQNVRYRTPGLIGRALGGRGACPGNKSTRDTPNIRNLLGKRAYYSLWSSARARACVLHGGKSRGMQAPTESGPLRETAGAAGPSGSSFCLSHSKHVYDLRPKDGCSDRFFKDVARFCDELTEGIERSASSILNGYSRHVQLNLCEAPRSRGEYALDLLALGMAVSIYAPKTGRTPRWAVVAARELGRLRHHAEWMKPAVDRARGVLFKGFLNRTFAAGRGSEAKGAELLRRLPALVEWMRATGELEQEAHARRSLAALPGNA